MGLLSKGRERRKYPRYTKKISVHIKNRSHRVSGKLEENHIHDDFPQATMGKDISRGGLCFYSEVAYEADTVLKMTIRIAGIKDEAGRTPMYMMSSTVPIRAEAQVVWCRSSSSGQGYEVGVEFKDIYGDDYNILQKNLTD